MKSTKSSPQRKKGRLLRTSWWRWLTCWVIVIVYCRSEALKYGLPLEDVLDIIMDSNESKLGADGKPIYDANGKFLKGPNYWRPEPKIKVLLEKAASN